jgi:hypothetical protein
MPALLEVAADHAAARRRLALAAASEAETLWSRVDPGNIRSTWLNSLGRLLLVVAGAQRVAAGQADKYLDYVLTAQRISPVSHGLVNPAALTGVASDGRDLMTLLYQPVITALVGIGSGNDVPRALASGRSVLDMIVRTQVADAGRAADQVAMAARPQVTGYVRMLVGRSCSRCAILAGRHYSWRADFKRHPRCLPAGVAVSGPRVDAATRRWYQGELVVVSTASGQELPITGNHPVLTDRGWIPAHLLQEGDHVVRSTRSQGATSLAVPGEDQMPALIEDLWRPNGVMPFLHVPTTTEDFHGDGGHGEVDVVLSDRFLRNWVQPTLDQLAEQVDFAGRIAKSALFTESGALNQVLVGLLSSANSVVGGGGLLLPFGGGHSAGSDLSGCGHVPNLYSGGLQVPADGASRNPVATAQAVLALASVVSGGKAVDVQPVMASRWDPPAGPLSMETRLAYSDRGQDLLLRLAGQVELDRVVDVRRVEWSGHVYNLTSVEGWYSANGLIVSNCDCTAVPAREDTADDLRTDPKRYFDSLSAAEQSRQFTVAGAEAIRSGADVAQVVNARSGMYSAAGQSLTRSAAGIRGQGGIRLMPEQILREANGDRDEALRLLKRFGYLT